MPGWSDMHDRVPVPAIRKSQGAVNTAKRYAYEVIAHRYAEFMGLV